MKKKEGKYTTIHYQNYLQIDQILGAQKLRSSELDQTPAHEEMLFIIIHQVYELWFKQILHELYSVAGMFRNDYTDERNLGMVVGRLDRVAEILRLLIQQIHVLETMTPLDFLDFRNYLFPASGFQSFQFREVEVLLGLKESQRLTYGGHSYKSALREDQRIKLDEIEHNGTLLELIEKWLERTPFLNIGEFQFLPEYKKAVERMLEKDKKAIMESEYLTESEKEMRLKMTGGTDTYFKAVLDPFAHEQLVKDGSLSFSYKATVAALLINLYRDQPILNMPYLLLMSILDIDELMTTWRFRHAQMVERMIGNKIGTGGSSGHSYLAATATKHRIFKDLHSISSLLIPRSELPELPDQLKKELGFYFRHK